MKKTAKILAVVLCLSLFAGMALASGESSSDKSKKSVVTSGDSGSKAADQSSKKGKSSSKKSTTTIDPQVLLDKDGIKITAEKYINDSVTGDGVQLLVENNTDKTYTIGCDALIVNDYMITDLFSTDVAPGKKSNATMDLLSSELNAAGIDKIGKIEMYFHAYTTDSMDYLFHNEYSMIQTSDFADMDTTPNDTGSELYNQNGIRIVGKTVDEDSFWGTAILLYIENNSGQNVDITTDELSVNGYMMDPVFSATVYNGKKSIDDITLLSSDLEANGIKSIDQVELKFNISNPDTYETIAESDPITFSAK
ncbi:MAG: hypothetical protein PUE58_06730 [Lachnospiraceae bacterium]|nr:hypothetical protein [Lachnospiraceae bacterium]